MEMGRLNLRVPKEKIERLRKLSKREGLAMNVLISLAIEEYLNRNKIFY